MDGSCLKFNKPIEDAISRIRFAPQSNNLLISSWDSSLRLYDADCSLLRLEAPSEAALLDCCFGHESAAFSAGSDGLIRRYDLHSGTFDTVGNHDDIATCIQYSNEKCEVISAGLDKKLMSWDIRRANTLVFSRNLDAEVESMSLSGFDLTVAIGSSINMYDLRNLDSPVQSDESSFGVQIRCVFSVPYSTALRLHAGYAAGTVDGRVKLEMSYPSNSNHIDYVFRCHPKSKDGRYYLAPVNDIAFNPLITGALVTGDNEGYVIAWDGKNRKRLFELPRFSKSVASVTYNRDGDLLAVASGYTYQEANETEEPPQISVYKMDDSYDRSVSAGNSR
ncbi:hypothetical protein SLE2022_333990 [Rubroshorea leprosula]